jgi:hypothetical protein
MTCPEMPTNYAVLAMRVALDRYASVPSAERIAPTSSSPRLKCSRACDRLSSVQEVLGYSRFRSISHPLASTVLTARKESVLPAETELK